MAFDEALDTSMSARVALGAKDNLREYPAGILRLDN